MSQQQKQLLPNRTHKVFHINAIVEKLPLVIECLTSYDNLIIMGTNSGRILIYEMKLNQLTDTNFEVTLDRTITGTKKPIQQLEAIKKFNILLALFDSQLHVYELDKFALKYSINKSKGCSLFATSLANDQKVLRLCVACKKRLQFYYFNKGSNSQFMELVSDLELNDTPKTLEFTKDNLIVFSLRKDYYYYELPSTSSALNQRQPEARFSVGNRTLEPLSQKLHNEYFVLGHDEQNTILYDTNGKPYLQYPIVWSSCPSMVCSAGPYLVAILPASNCLEVASIEPLNKSLQIIEFARDSSAPSPSVLSTSSPSSFLSSVANVANNVSNLAVGGGGGSSGNPADRIKFLCSNGNGVFYAATQSSVWCLTPININEQLEQCFRLKNYDLGLGLIQSHLKFNNLDKTPSTFNQTWLGNNSIDSLNAKEKTNILLPFFSITVMFDKIDENLQRKLENFNALELFRRKKFSESFELFQKMKIDPCHLIASVPGLLPDYYRNKLKLDEYFPDLNSKELEEVINALIDYLQFKRAEILKENKPLNDPTNLSLLPLVEGRAVLKTRIQLLEIIDTTLLKCYLKAKESLVPFVLRREQNFLHLEQSERLLLQHNKISELIILYEKKEEHERALNLLNTESTKSSSNLFGLKPMIKYLKKIGNNNLELIFKYAKSIIQQDSELGMQIFMDNTVDIDKILASRLQQKEQMKARTRKSLANIGAVLNSSINSRKMSNQSNFKNQLMHLNQFDPIEDIIEDDELMTTSKSRKKDSYVGDMNNKLFRSSSIASSSGFGQNNTSDIVIDEDDEILKKLNHELVCKFLAEQIEPGSVSLNLVRVYLQHCIYVWNDTNPNLNNQLIDTYITFIQNNNENSNTDASNLSSLSMSFNSPTANGSKHQQNLSKTYKQMLTYFLNETNYYEPNYALARLDLENYAEQRAIVLGKQGKHNEALSIYVNILNETDKAEAYCDEVYLQSNIADSKQVYYTLLQIYLNSDYEEIRIGASIRLLNAHSNEIGSCRTLESLPADLMKCKNLSPFFENMLNRLVRNRHNTQILNRLMFALELQIHETKIMYQDKKFIVNDEQVCNAPYCNKRIGKSAMVRFPDGRLIHYGCLKNSTDAFGSSATGVSVTNS